MYIKSKWKTWLFLIGIALAIKVLPGHIHTFLAQRAEKKQADAIVTTYTIAVDGVSSAIKNQILEDKINVNGTNVRFTDSFGEPDIIITRADEMHDGYAKLKNYLYVPYVMVSNPNLASTSQDCFGEIDKNKFKKDIRYILSAMEEDKKWKDLGLDGDSVVKGKVGFIIPDEYSMAYRDIREYFILALNDFKMPSEDEMDALCLRADSLLAKCTKVESIQSEFTKSSWFKQIIFCAESIIAERPSNFGKCIIINPGKTIKADYNVYVKEDKLEEVKTILKSYQFLELSGFRNIEYNNVLDSNPYSKSFMAFDYVDEKIPEEMQKPITTIAKEMETTAESTEETAETIEETKEAEKEMENETETSTDETEELESTEAAEQEESSGSEEEDGTSFLDILLGIFLVILLILVVVGLAMFIWY